MIQGPIARKPGVELSLYRACLLIAQRAKGVVRVQPWSDGEVVDQVIRAAQTPTSMADAPEIVQVMDEFVAALVENSAAASLFGLATNRTFGRAGVVAIHEISELPQADWIAEGAPMPVVMGLSALTSMVPHKIGTMVALTNEMMASASAEAIIRQKLIDNVGPALDRSLFSAAPGVPGLRPPGLLNGLTPIGPAAPPTSPSEMMIEDVENLVDALAAYGGNGQIALISSVKQSVRLKKFALGETGYPVFVTNAVTDTLIAVATRALAVAIDPPSIEASDAGVFHMEDTTPLPIVANPTRSAWQTDSVALRFRLPVSWVLRAPAVAYTNPAW
jgi:Phage capsid family